MRARHYERHASLRAAPKSVEPSRLQAALERLQRHGVVDRLSADAIRLFGVRANISMTSG
jgi:hypothetical protein